MTAPTIRVPEGEAGLTMLREALLLAHDPAFDEQMAHAERIMEEDKEILQRLAR